MKDQENAIAAEMVLCEHLSTLLVQGRDMLRAGKVDAYYRLLPDIDKDITDLALRVKKWGKNKKMTLGRPWKRDLIERFKGLQEAASESERLAHRSVELTFNGLMQLSQALTPAPTYAPKASPSQSPRAMVFDQQA
jgi:hypothetical protein